MQWDRRAVEKNFQDFVETERRRGGIYADPNEAAAYYVLAFDGPNLDRNLNGLTDMERHVGVYTIDGERAWQSRRDTDQFEQQRGNALSMLMADLLQDCMAKGQKDVGTFGSAHAALKPYLGIE